MLGPFLQGLREVRRVPVAEGATCSLEVAVESGGWSLEISPVCLRSKIYLAGGDGVSITISKILFLKLLL